MNMSRSKISDNLTFLNDKARLVQVVKCHVVRSPQNVDREKELMLRKKY